MEDRKPPKEGEIIQYKIFDSFGTVKDNEPFDVLYINEKEWVAFDRYILLKDKYDELLRGD